MPTVFFIGYQDGPKKHWVRHWKGPYASLEAAKDECTIDPPLAGRSYRIFKEDRPDPNPQEWHLREKRRFTQRIYTAVPWGEQRFARPFLHHFAHVSLDDPTLIAYTPTNRHGEEDVQTKIKPGRYLAKYFSNVLTESERQSWERSYAAKFYPAEVKFATTEEEIEWVYTHGPASCMSHPVSEFSTKGYHPTRIYAAGDLAIAWIPKYSGSNIRVSARCLVWPEKKIWGRMYGDIPKLRKSLEALGYRPATSGGSPIRWRYGEDDGRSSMAGARLLRVIIPARDRSCLYYICPFVDAPNERLRDDGTFLIIDPEGEIDAAITDGVVDASITGECSNCHNPEAPDVRQGISEDGVNSSWCRDCRDDNGTYTCPDCGCLWLSTRLLRTSLGTYLCAPCATQRERDGWRLTRCSGGIIILENDDNPCCCLLCLCPTDNEDHPPIEDGDTHVF